MAKILDFNGKVLFENNADNLIGANLRNANLSYADLRNANLSQCVIPTGERWEQYLSEVVPSLCICEGKTLEEVSKAWDCHEWSNCPMSIAFSVNKIENIPILYKPRVEQFIQFFDQNLIPNPCGDK